MKTRRQQPLITFKIYRDRFQPRLCTLAGSIVINDPCAIFSSGVATMSGEGKRSWWSHARKLAGQQQIGLKILTEWSFVCLERGLLKLWIRLKVLGKVQFELSILNWKWIFLNLLELTYVLLKLEGVGTSSNNLKRCFEIFRTPSVSTPRRHYAKRSFVGLRSRPIRLDIPRTIPEEAGWGAHGSLIRR